MSEAPKKRWYVVQAFSGFEGRVATSLREHIKLHNMEDLFGEVMVPTEEVVEIRGGQRRKSERKFFPGYVTQRSKKRRFNRCTRREIGIQFRAFCFYGPCP